jgi:hypothetical protein
MKKNCYLKNIHIQRIRSKRTVFQGEPAYDVREIGEPLGKYTSDVPIYFELRGFDDNGVVYFDRVSQRRIQSIGVRKSDGKIIASLMADLYGLPEYDCIWLC